MNDFIKKVLPWIGAAATGGVPALVTLAAGEVGKALGVTVEAKPEKIAQAVANATPEQIKALRELELGFQERMQAMGFKHVEDLARLALEETKTFVGDTADARARHAGNSAVFKLGVAIVITFAIVMCACLWGSYKILTGGIVVKDVALVAAVAGFVGTIVGYVAANAQQVIAYFFGSSKGSSDKTSAMADAVKAMGAR